MSSDNVKPVEKFIRFLRLDLQIEAVPVLREAYETRVIPGLQETGGCLFAMLSRGARHPEHVLSTTFWADKKTALSYEKSPLYQGVINELRPFLWGLPPLQGVPPSELHAVLAWKQMVIPAPTKMNRMYTRMLHQTIRKETLATFSETYQRDIIPALQAFGGCYYTYLLKDEEDSENITVTSMTIWESREKAEQCENSGLLNPLALKTGNVGKITINDYTVISGEQFK